MTVARAEFNATSGLVPIEKGQSLPALPSKQQFYCVIFSVNAEARSGDTCNDFGEAAKRIVISLADACCRRSDRYIRRCAALALTLAAIRADLSRIRIGTGAALCAKNASTFDPTASLFARNTL